MIRLTVLGATRLAIPVGLATLFLAFLLCGLRAAIPVHADPGTLYVDGTSGSDATSCTVPSAPCATIGYALSQARDGDTCLTAPSSLVNGGGNGTVLISNTIQGDSTI